MSDKIILRVDVRQVIGKKVKSLRAQGLVPGVVYGHNFDPKPVVVEYSPALKVWKEAGRRHPVDLEIGDTKRLAIIKSADLDPVKRRLRHLSFQIIKQNEKVETEVPLRITGEGETAAEKAGLVVLQALETVKVSALPKNLPDAVEVPGDKLVAAGDHVSVGDIVVPEGVTILTEPEIVAASVYEPSAMAAAEAEEEKAEEAEPAAEAETEQAKPEEASQD